jgi:hypothetical protein
MESNILNSHVISIEEKKGKDVAQEFYHLLRVLPHDIHSKEISSHEFLHKCIRTNGALYKSSYYLKNSGHESLM